MTAATCRVCGYGLNRSFVDLGFSPLANSFVSPAESHRGEMTLPLHALVCEHCFLVQLEEFESPATIFSEYAYFSGFSDSWLQHAKSYASEMIEKLGLGSQHKVVEIASNDGYLLQYFASKGVQVLGVDPAANVAKVAEDRGIPTIVDFFGASVAKRLLKEGHSADLMAANNVLAHVPNIIDFTAGFAILLKLDGIGTFEFPHFLRMFEQRQFDTIYHEHFSYLSLRVVSEVLQQQGLRVFDVEELPTHGGSLRVFFCHDGSLHRTTSNVARVLKEERGAGIFDFKVLSSFASDVTAIKFETLKALIALRESGKVVCAYGAAAKGNTFLNYCGIGTELVKVIADKSPYKQGMLAPGSRIPVVSPDDMLSLRPDMILILPWNLQGEIAAQLPQVREWGGQFMTAVPRLNVF
jgi:hypothetical protein